MRNCSDDHRQGAGDGGGVMVVTALIAAEVLVIFGLGDDFIGCVFASMHCDRLAPMGRYPCS